MCRMPASLNTLNVATSNVYNKCNLATNVNWNQSSDRNVAGIQKSVVPSRGDSTRHTLTRARPGACSAGGKGVDIKHGSYDRYLARLKGKSCNPVPVSTDVQILTATFVFEVGDFCWALIDPIGPFYKALITEVNSPYYTIQFLVNGVADVSNPQIRTKTEILIYMCAC